MFRTEKERKLIARIEEIRAIYGISDAEGILLHQMIDVIQLTMHIPLPLLKKLLEAGAAMVDMIIEEKDK